MILTPTIIWLIQNVILPVVMCGGAAHFGYKYGYKDGVQAGIITEMERARLQRERFASAAERHP